MNNKMRSSEGGHARRKFRKRSPESSQSAGAVARATRREVVRANESAREIEAEMVRFRVGDRTINFNIDVTRETVWATQQQIADLFGVDQSVISKHIKNVFDCNELDEDDSTHAKIALVQIEGARAVTREISHYSLDVILSVGYRVDSRAATDFRRWATAILRSYVIKGYAINERRLGDDPRAASDLAARLREIRSEEQHVFARVREFFKAASVDYDPQAKDCRTFYAILQDKCHFAATGHTASELILTRADYRSPNMGMTTFSGKTPTVADAKIGKNYLSEDELHILHIVGEMFLLHVESMVFRKSTMTMAALATKFDDLLKVGEYAIFCGYGKDCRRGRADKHAVAEFARFMMRQKKVA